jgi:membrane protein required for colicin V production
VPEGFSFSDVIADKLSSALSYIAVFAVAFTLVAIVFAVIGNLIGFVFALPGLRLLDVIAGTVFGLVKGLIIVMAIATVVRYFGLLALDLIEDTTVLNYFINQNIVADILGI